MGAPAYRRTHAGVAGVSATAAAAVRGEVVNLCNGHLVGGLCVLESGHDGECDCLRDRYDRSFHEAIEYLRGRVRYLEERAMADGARIAKLEMR